MTAWFRRLRARLRYRGFDADLAREIETHRAMKQAELESIGLSAADARAGAARALGNVIYMREEARGVWIGRWLAAMWQDLRYAARGFRRQPGFALIAVFALGGAIGLNTSIFTVFNTVFLARWPVQDAARVVRIRASSIPIDVTGYQQLAAETRALSGLVALACPHCRVRFHERTGVRFNAVSANFFGVLGVPMALGRTFGAADDSPTVPAQAVILSHRVWRRDFASDPRIIGTPIVLNDVTAVIVGVAPRTFTGITGLDDAPDFWVPLSAAPLFEPRVERRGSLMVVGRLGKGVSIENAQAELALLIGRLGRESGAAGTGSVTLGDSRYLALPTLERLGAFGLMTLGALLVLFLACANVGNLLLARAASRTREMATRLSIGASRGRLLRQLLTESLLLAVAACLFGIALSFVLPELFIDRMTALSDRPMEYAVRFVPDLTVLGFACALAATSVVLFGLAPALLASKQDLSATAKEHGGRLAARVGPRRVLLAAQVAISTVLLVSAGLTVRSVQHGMRVDLGFDFDQVIEVAVEPPEMYDGARALQSVQAILDSSQRVDPAETALWGQSFGRGSTTRAEAVGTDVSEPVDVGLFRVTPSVFRVMGIPIVAGATLDRESNGVVISESLAAALFPAASPIGRFVRFRGTPRPILGVAGDADVSGASFTREFTRRATIYEPLSSLDFGTRVLVRRDLPGQLDALVALAARVDPRVRIRATALTEYRDNQLKWNRFGAVLAGLLGMLALTIAAIGIAGVFGCIAQHRTREIGIRIALGGRSSHVVREEFGPSVRALVIGLGVGVALACIAVPLLRGWVHPGIGRVDPVTLVTVVLILSAAAFIATYGPVRRASRMNPVQALRHD